MEQRPGMPCLGPQRARAGLVESIPAGVGAMEVGRGRLAMVSRRKWKTTKPWRPLTTPTFLGRLSPLVPALSINCPSEFVPSCSLGFSRQEKCGWK